MHGRVDVAKGPFVGWQLAVGMHIALVEHQQQLVLSKITVDERHGNTMERQVPGGVPGILPGIWHDDDIEVRKVPPTFIATALWWWWRPCRITPEPCVHIIIEELLTPEQASQCLALYHALILHLRRADRSVKFVCFCNACGEQFLGIGKWRTLQVGR
jgi:hypothetical protein